MRWIGDAGEVLDLDRDECATQIFRWIADCTACSNGVAKDLACQHPCAMCGLVCAARFYLSNCIQQVASSHTIDRYPSDVWT